MLLMEAESLSCWMGVSKNNKYSFGLSFSRSSNFDERLFYINLFKLTVVIITSFPLFTTKLIGFPSPF